ncbi:MAG: hypothetical protein V4671_01645 [Armatimonadota bacterium]
MKGIEMRRRYNRYNRYKPTILAAGIGLSFLTLAGCRSAERDARIVTPITAEAKAKAIRDNPNIPEAAKRDAIAALQGQHARGAAPGEKPPVKSGK